MAITQLRIPIVTDYKSTLREEKFPEVLIQPDVRVLMRDGVQLLTDIYLPAKDLGSIGEKMPALLRRTPYNKGRANNEEAMRLARHGYVVAVQDVRGRFASDGVFDAFAQEAEDGYDAIEWLATHPLCDGRVGTFGGSYEGFAQAAAQTQAPPHLAATCHYFSYPHGYHSVHQGGALDVFWLSYFVMMAADGKEAAANQNVKEALLGMRYEEWLDRYPIREGQSPLSLAPSYEKTYFDYLRHECLDEFWMNPGLCPAEFLGQWSDVPTLWVCGWYDHYAYCHPDTLAFTRLKAMGHKNQYVVFGPWTHGETDLNIGQSTFGDASIREKILPDYHVRWFDKWFKGIDDEGVFEKPVQYFVMGGGPGILNRKGLFDHGGAWEKGEVWPPECEPLALNLKEGARLSEELPTVESSSTSYQSNPEDPCPSSTGVTYTVTRLSAGATRRINTNGAWNQMEGCHLYGVDEPFLPLESRRDVLVFQTEPLADDLKAVGHPVVELWVCSDAPDCDFVAKIVDLYPPSEDHPLGFAVGISEGIQRAKFRNGNENPELMSPGEVYQIRIEMRPLANLFKIGHRIRLDLTSSSWPHFDINTHTGRNPSEDHERRIAHNTIFHEKNSASRLLLPGE
jgi:putative CocE/NonD family hydrolase